MPRQFLRATLASSLALVFAATALGQAPAAPAPAQAGANPVPPLPPDMLALRPKVDMTLQQAVALSLDKNFDIQLQKYSMANTSESLYTARARYWPILTVSSTGPQITETKTTSTTTGISSISRATTWNTGASVSQNLPTGGSVTVSTTPFNRSGDPHTYGTGLGFSFNHPILRGFGKRIAQTNLRNAELSVESAANSYKARILDTVQSVENAYTNLISARETYDVRRRSEQISQKRFEETMVRRGAGLNTEIDVNTDRQALLTGTNSRIQAELSVRQAEDTLRNLLGAGDFDVAINPTTDVGDISFPKLPEDTTTYNQFVQSAYKLTLENSTDYQNRLLAIQQQENSLQVTRNALKPSLAVTGGMSASGRDTAISDSWTSSAHRDNYSWNVGLTLSVTIGQYSERSALRQGLNSLSSTKLGLQQLQQNLLIQVRNAIRTLDTAQRSLDTAILSKDLAVQNYEADYQRFVVGSQTQLNILNRQQTQEQAELSYLQARFSLRQAITALQRLEGTTLDRYGITVPNADLPEIEKAPDGRGPLLPWNRK